MIIRVNLYISDYAISPFLYGCLASRSSRVKHGRGPTDLRSPRSNPRPPLPESREAETRLPLLKKQTRKSVRYRSALAHCTVISFPRLLPPVPLSISRPPSRPAHRLSDEREAGRPRVQARSSSPPPEPRPPASRPPRRRNGKSPRPRHQPPPALLLVRPAAPLRGKMLDPDASLAPCCSTGSQWRSPSRDPRPRHWARAWIWGWGVLRACAFTDSSRPVCVFFLCRLLSAGMMRQPLRLDIKVISGLPFWIRLILQCLLLWLLRSFL